ncbi:hypothetical protein FHG87_015234 [Trinorchestia longiramus]|nr:hypothetical protein FHG87_015234 [Trinorchestia longiramus]
MFTQLQRSAENCSLLHNGTLTSSHPYEHNADIKGLHEVPVDVRSRHKLNVDVTGFYEPSVDVRGPHEPPVDSLNKYMSLKQRPWRGAHGRKSYTRMVSHPLPFISHGIRVHLHHDTSKKDSSTMTTSKKDTSTITTSKKDTSTMTTSKNDTSTMTTSKKDTSTMTTSKKDTSTMTTFKTLLTATSCHDSLTDR